MENKLIKINLNQTLNRFELAEIKEERKRWLFFSIFSISFIIIMVFNFFISYMHADLIELRLDDTQRLIKEKIVIQNEYKDKNSLLDDSFSFEQLTEDDVSTLYGIEARKLSIAPLLEALAFDLPENMSILEILYTYEKQEFEIHLISENDASKYVDDKNILDQNIEDNFILILEEQDGLGWNHDLKERGDKSERYKSQPYLHTHYVINKESN